MKYEPTLHKSIPLQTRVIVPESYLGPDRESYAGRVVGISFLHVIFMYIVLLDVPVETEYGLTSAICVNGAELMNEQGEYAWRLKEPIEINVTA